MSRLFGIKGKASVSLAVLLAQSGEFALVLFALAKGMGLLDASLFQHLLIVVLLGMLATPALDKLAYRISFASGKRIITTPDVDVSNAEGDAKPVILAGFGRMGHRIGYVLDLMNVPYVAIDADASLVDRERAEGKHVYFGDAQRPEVLRAAGAAETPLVIVSIDDREAAERVVASLHSAFPDAPVFARGHDLARCHDLRTLGADFTVSETLEASAELARAALLHIGADDSDVEAALERFRQDYYGRIDNILGVEKIGEHV